MSKDLSEGQNVVLGIVAAIVDGLCLQPTYYWKNSKIQNKPFSIDPKLLYRGTFANILNKSQVMGIQFGLTGYFGKMFKVYGKQTQEFCGSTTAGLVASLFASPLELIMIQQQHNGGTILKTPIFIVKQFGVLQNGLYRGLLGTAIRDSIYVCGMLGITPIAQEYLQRKHHASREAASVGASIVGGITASLPSHPFDCIKTCMQGDLSQTKYKSFLDTAKTLYATGGTNRLFNGVGWRTLSSTLGFFIVNEIRNKLGPVVKRYDL